MSGLACFEHLTCCNPPEIDAATLNKLLNKYGWHPITALRFYETFEAFLNDNKTHLRFDIASLGAELQEPLIASRDSPIRRSLPHDVRTFFADRLDSQTLPWRGPDLRNLPVALALLSFLRALKVKLFEISEKILTVQRFGKRHKNLLCIFKNGNQLCLLEPLDRIYEEDICFVPKANERMERLNSLNSTDLLSFMENPEALTSSKEALRAKYLDNNGARAVPQFSLAPNSANRSEPVTDFTAEKEQQAVEGSQVAWPKTVRRSISLELDEGTKISRFGESTQGMFNLSPDGYFDSSSKPFTLQKGAVSSISSLKKKYDSFLHKMSSDRTNTDFSIWAPASSSDQKTNLSKVSKQPFEGCPKNKRGEAKRNDVRDSVCPPTPAQSSNFKERCANAKSLVKH